MDLDLSCVQSLLVVLDEGHYGRAATRMHLTASALTKRIQRLERQLGTTLVTRDGNGLAIPTPAARRFRAPAAQLLSDADRACRLARATRQPRQALTLGVPSGGMPPPLRGILPKAVHEFRTVWSGAQVTCRPVGYAGTQALLDKVIDVLWTFAPVPHSAVVSVPLSTLIDRVGILSPHHDLTDTDSIGADQFAELPMLYNPAVPDKLMSLFYLGDLRPRKHAQLISADIQSVSSLMQQVARTCTVTVGALGYITGSLPPGFSTVYLTGASPLIPYAARRRSDRRGSVDTFIEALTKG